MSAPNPFSIAIGGLRPGGSTLEIGSQGMLTITITPPTPEPENEDVGLFVPMVWASPRTRQDCVIHVSGCRASVSTTGDNIAASNPSTAELDEEMDRAEAELMLLELEAKAEAYRQRQYLIKWNEVMPRWREHQEKKAKRREFQKEAAALAADFKKHNDPAEDLAAIIVFLKDEISELSARIGELESEKTTAKPKPKTRRRK
jgi:hypothetical protein